MSSAGADFSQNISIVRPEYFFINGLSGIPYSTYFYIFLFFIYIVAVIGNSVVLLIIALDRSLHSPKYIGVFNLALSDFGETNSLVPIVMKIFVFDSQYVAYNACLANMFFVHFFSSMQSLTLVVLSYDRFIAICLPLRYHAIVNNTFMSVVILVLWAFNISMMSFMVFLVSQLSFCKTNVVQSYFCDHGPVYRLACNDNRPNAVVAKLCTALYIATPAVIILLSYLCIFLALSRITTWEGRLKALKTCVSHLLLVGSYFLPVICIYIVSFMYILTPNARVFSTSLAYSIPPMLNPIIYVLNTAEIKDIIRKFLKTRLLKTQIESVSS